MGKRPTNDVRVRIEKELPGLAGGSYRVSSPIDGRYNCAAFAAEDQNRVWWPALDAYWPDTVRRVDTIDAFVEAFHHLGFEPCDLGDQERGVDRIAIYADAQGLPQHVARQRPDGKWVSKLGSSVDIEHENARALEGELYGKVVSLLRRVSDVAPPPASERPSPAPGV